jgi:hypothetical protein
MMETNVRHRPTTRQRTPGDHEELMAELRAIRDEQVSLCRLFDQFAGSYLNARFPYGKPTDRWPQR